VAQTKAEEKKVQELKKEVGGMAALKKKGFLLNLAGTIFFTCLFVFLVYSASQNGEVNSFDPFAILELDHNADAKAIKKAFRKLSLQWHPDKNPGNRAAAAKFMMLNKAYESLTDVTARENWEKYGNPDGRQAMEFMIGLPSFLLESSNRNLVLVAYLIMMVGVVPYCVYTYYADSSKYGEKDVMYDSYAWFHNNLSEHTLLKALPEILAGAAEFRKRNLPASAEERKAIASQMAVVKSQVMKPKFNHPVCVKGNVLLHSHLLRKTETLTEKDRDDLRYMLRVADPLLEAMISVCKHSDTVQTAINCIEFQQYMTQAMWVKDSPLLQLPYYGGDQAKECEKAKVHTIAEYKEVAEADRKGTESMTETQKADIRQCLRIYPSIEVEARVFVDDDEDDKVYESDIVTIRVTITRTHLDKGEQVGYVHSPHFPFPKKEAFWVMLGQMKAGKIMSIEKVTKPGRVVSHDIKFMAPPEGHYEFDLFVKSNGYVGMDQKTHVVMETLDNKALPAYKIHPDDAELDDEPTLFEEILNAHVEEDSDDEDEEDDDEKEAEKEPINDAAARKREQLRKARQATDDDDDDSDDDDAEDVTPGN
jgi:translocation protein SEC63